MRFSFISSEVTAPFTTGRAVTSASCTNVNRHSIELSDVLLFRQNLKIGLAVEAANELALKRIDMIDLMADAGFVS
jgi:hypothetical protein